MGNSIDYFRKTPVLYEDPTIQALCGSLDRIYHNDNNGLFYDVKKILLYDFEQLGIFKGHPELMPGLKAYYKFNDNLATKNVINSVSSDYQGTSINNTEDMYNSTGIIDGCLVFNGVDDEVDISDLAPLIGQGLDCTIGGCFYGNGVTRTIIGDSSSGVNKLGLRVIVSGGAFSASVHTTGVAYGKLTHNGALDAGWNFWSLTIPANSAANGFIATAVLTLNGVDNSATFSANQGAFTPTDLFIGRDDTNYDTGSQDQIYFYSEALTPANTTSIFNSGDGTFPQIDGTILDYIANQFRLYIWDTTLTSVEKIAKLRSGILLKRKIGTPYAVKGSIEAVADADHTDFDSYPIVLTEGTGGYTFDGSWTYDGSVTYDSHYSPFLFDVEIPWDDANPPVAQQ